jgi:hypothetical protein
MSSPNENFSPYTSVGSMLSVLKQIRKGWVPPKIDPGEMVRIGITKSLASRTMATLEYLGLIEDDGGTTDVWKAIATATTDDYPKVLAGILRNAYPTIFEIHPNPASATDLEIQNAFSKSEPLMQRGRMQSLFRGLCQEAGLMSGEPLTRDRKAVTKKQPAQKSVSKDDSEKRGVAEKPKDELSSERINPALKWYKDLETLMSRLPKSEGSDAKPKWTSGERNRWLAALQSMLDLLIDVDEPKE